MRCDCATATTHLPCTYRGSSSQGREAECQGNNDLDSGACIYLEATIYPLESFFSSILAMHFFLIFLAFQVTLSKKMVDIASGSVESAEAAVSVATTAAAARYAEISKAIVVSYFSFAYKSQVTLASEKSVCKLLLDKNDSCKPHELTVLFVATALTSFISASVCAFLPAKFYTIS